MEINQLIIVVTLLVVYYYDLKSMYQNLQNIQHMNIIYKMDLFFQPLLEVKTWRSLIKSITSIPILNKDKNTRNETIDPPETPKNTILFLITEEVIWKTRIRGIPIWITKSWKIYHLLKNPIDYSFKEKRKGHCSYLHLW